MTAVFSSNVFQNNVFQVGDAAAAASDIVFQCNIFQHDVFAVGDACRGGVATTGDPGGLSTYPHPPPLPIPGLRRRRQEPEERERPQPVPVITPDQSRPSVEQRFNAPSLPTLMVGFGGVVGIQAPSLRDAIDAQILADDEDAIIAILLAAQ